jgi:AraC-like DNA-binding protein
MCVPWKSRGAAGVDTPSTVVPPLRAIRAMAPLFSAGKFRCGADALVRRASCAWSRVRSRALRFASNWYQKQIRLQQARLRLLANPADVAGTGHAVGYTSASQFSREYRRLFGTPPGRDAAQLQNASRTPG